MTDAGSIASRLAAVRARIDAVARAAGRNGSDVRIVAVSKKLGIDRIRAAYAAGLRDFGENYVQEAAGKIEALSAGLPDARWHLVGRLQSNKAVIAVRSFALLHGIDSAGTVAALSRAALRSQRVVDLLLQVRLGPHTVGATAVSPSSAVPGRAGVEADEAAGFLEQCFGLEGVRFVGLMGVADPAEPARPQFAALRELRERLAALAPGPAPLAELSMGMTGDFEDAVAEGATIVRIGTAIFGERPHA